MATRRGPDNTVRVAITGNRVGINWANILWFQLTTSSSVAQADLDTWLTTIATDYKNAFAPRQDNAVAYVLATGTLFQPGGGVLQSTSSMTGSGSETGTSVTDNAFCKVVSWLSNVYWRGGKPRMYSPGGVSTDLTNAATLTSTERTNMATAANSFRTAVNAVTQGTITGTTLGFVSFSSGNAPRPSPLFFAVTGAKCHQRPGTQRRRLGPWVA